MTSSIFLSLMLSISPDAGAEEVTFSSPIYDVCPEAPPIESLDGGWKLFPPERAQRTACLMTVCDVDRTRRENEMKEDNGVSWVWVSSIALAAASLGFTLGSALKFK